MWTHISQTVSLYPTCSFALTMLFFGWIGYLIVTKYLMQKQIRNFLPKTIFTLTFMCSCGLLAMYLYEISQFNIPDVFWDVILSVLVFLCVMIIPACLLFRFPFALYKFKIYGQNFPVFAVVIIILYFRILSYWSSQIKTMKKIDDQVALFSKQYINILVQIGVYGGVYIMAFMSAYGSIWCPYIYFNHIDTLKKQLKQAKKKTMEEIHFIIDQIKNNKYELLILSQKQELLKKSIQKKKQENHSSSFIVRGIKSLSIFKDQEKKQYSSVKQKILFHQKQLETLHKVHQESYSVYREIVDQERKHNISQTYMGKLFRLFSFILCVYSVTKIILTAWNMIKGRKLSTDPITRLLGFFVWITGQNVNGTVRTYSQYISFGFMGYLMISNVRSFSINMKNFFDFIFRRRKINILQTDTLVLLLSQMYGIYFLSAVILLQSSLPRTYVTNFEQITGQVLLVEHFTLFDKLFFWSCLVSASFICVCEYQRKQKMKYIIKERNLV